MKTPEQVAQQTIDTFEGGPTWRLIVAAIEADRAQRTMTEEQQIAAAAKAFAIAAHGDSADQQDADYYAPMLRIAVAAMQEVAK